MSLIRINRAPSSRHLLTFAIAWVSVAGSAALVGWYRGRPWFAASTGLVALAIPTLRFVHPPSVRLMFIGLIYATYPIGVVVSWALLAGLYFGVLTPLGIVARLLRYDPLASRFAPSQQTYWQPREAARDVTEYFRQR